MAKKQTVKAAVSRESYAIEKILDSRRTDDGQLEYLIKWKDSPESDNSWQLVGDLFSKKKNSPEIMCDASVNDVSRARPQRKRKAETSSKKPEPKHSQNDETPQASVERPQSQRVYRTGAQVVLTPIVVEELVRKVANPPPKNEENREVDRVQKLRKRKNQHEYLVKWKNTDDEEWIARDIMVSKYPESVIAFFQSISIFK